jgi:hypothetical protein
VDYVAETQAFNKAMKRYCDSITTDEYHLKPEYKFEMACHAKVTKGFDRFIKIYYGTSGSGKRTIWQSSSGDTGKYSQKHHHLRQCQ